MIYLLCQKVEALLNAAFTGQGFSTPTVDGSEAWAAPGVYLFDPPFKQSHNEPEHYPMVVIRPLDGDLASGGFEKDQVNLTLLCAVHNTHGKTAGLMELTNLIYQTRLALLGEQLLDQRFELTPPLPWSLMEPKEQEPPYYRGGIEAFYSFPMPNPGPLSPLEKVDHYGAGYPDADQT